MTMKFFNHCFHFSTVFTWSEFSFFIVAVLTYLVYSINLVSNGSRGLPNFSPALSSSTSSALNESTHLDILFVLNISDFLLPTFYYRIWETTNQIKYWKPNTCTLMFMLKIYDIGFLDLDDRNLICCFLMKTYDIGFLDLD